jgi:Flp pilus assembly protein TadB
VPPVADVSPTKRAAPKSAPRPRRRSVKKKAPEPEGLITGPSGGADRRSRGRRESSRLAEQVVLLALAILFGVIGFAVHFLWFGSIVLMAVLLGLIVSEMRSRRGKSVIADVVTTVMVEAKNVAEAIASGGDKVPEPQGQSSDNG